MDQLKPPPLRTLPPVLARFLYGTMLLGILCLVVTSYARFVLHEPFPYNTLFLQPRYTFYDFSMFFERFHYFHSTAFFTANAGYIVSYPATMVVLYKFSYVVTGESTRAYIAIMVLTFCAAAALLGRAMVRAHLAAAPATLFAATSLLMAYPMWFEISRANMEFYVWIFVCLGGWLFFRGKGYGAAACFGIAGSMKLFPYVYLGLFVAKKQYRQAAFALLVAVAVTVGSLWLICPSIGFAFRTLNQNISEFGRVNVLERRWLEIGLDHSIFGLIKAVVLHGNRVLLPKTWLTAYTAATAILGIVLFFTRIVYLPVNNQMLCLTIASVLLPASSFDYTLMHLYVPWAALVLLAVHAARAGKTIPGLNAAFVCFVILLSPENEFIYRLQRVGGQMKAIALIALWYIALKYPFACDEASEAAVPQFTNGPKPVPFQATT